MDVKYETPLYTLKITASLADARLTPTNPDMISLFKTIEDFCKAADVVEIKYKVSGTPELYNYSFKARDGRNWVQTLTYTSASDIDPLNTFNVVDGWRPSKYRLQMALKDLLSVFKVKMGVTDFKVDYY